MPANERMRPFERLAMITRIAHALVDGPHTIWPPKSRDPYGWLSQELRLTRRNRVGSLESVAIYLDSTVNRHRGFLRPLVRWAYWDRSAALEGLEHAVDSWPQVGVRTGGVRSWPATARLVQRLQRAVRRAPFSNRCASEGGRSGTMSTLRYARRAV